MKSTRAYNAMLDRYHFFKTETEAIAYAKVRKWRKYVISSNETGTCWTLAYTAKRV